MGIVLFRVDERLIHGQVVVGWGSELRASRYVVFDDHLATSAWEQDLYTLALPPTAVAEFWSTSEAVRVLPEIREDPRPSVVLLRSLEVVSFLGERAFRPGDALNLGGLPHKPGATAVRPYLHVDQADAGILKTLHERGIKVYGRDLPSSASVSPEELLACR
ncbi:MAG: PTS system mannose/fructose/N-acetylgalactosamine-transporter subunit IIB [Longimicrobiales bacterium]